MNVELELKMDNIVLIPNATKVPLLLVIYTFSDIVHKYSNTTTYHSWPHTEFTIESSYSVPHTCWAYLVEWVARLAVSPRI